MADRSVDLVIRARNEASATLKAITDSLSALSSQQDKTGKSAGAAGSTLSNLIGVLSDLSKTAKGLEAFGKVTAQLDTMSKVVQSVGTASAAAGAQVTRLTGDVERLSAASATANTNFKAAGAALHAQGIAAAADSKAVKTLTNDLASIDKQIDRLTAKSTTKKGLTPFETQNLSQLQNSQTRGTARLPGALSDAANSAQGLVELTAEYNRQATATKIVDDALTKTTRDLALSTSNAERLAATLAKVTAEEQALASAAGGVAARLGIVAGENDAAAAAAQRNADAQTRLKSVLEAARSTPGPVVNPGQFGTGGPAANAASNYREQVGSVDAAKEAMIQAQAAATALGRAVAAAGTPTAELATEFEIAKVQAQTATNAFHAQAQVLQSLRGSIRDTVAARQAQTTADAASAAAELRTIATARSVASAIETASAAHARFYGVVTGGVGVTQTATTSLGNLVAGYLSAAAALRLVSDAVQSAVTYEAAQVRVTLALGQGSEAGAAAFSNIADKARALKLDILPVVDSYGKFLSAVKGTAIEGVPATKIFQDLLTAARAFKLDPDAISRATIALRDMAATGTINLRFLRQLDQALPIGLLSRFATAAGYGADGMAKFTKELHAGRIGLDVLLPAFEAAAKDAEIGLPSALGTAQSSFADLRNAFLQTQIAFTSSGFLTSLVDAANDLNKALTDRAGQDSIASLGHLLAGLVNIFATLIPYAKVLVDALVGVGAIKFVGAIAGFEGFSGVLGGVITQLGVMRAASVAAAAATAEDAAALEALIAADVQAAIATGALTATTEAEIVAMGEIAGATGAATVAVGAFEAALAFLLTPVGITIALGSAVAALFAYVTSTTNATSASDDYNRVLGDLKAQIDGTKRSQDGLNTSVDHKSLIDAEAAVRSLTQAYADSSQALDLFATRQLRVAQFTKPFVSAAQSTDQFAVADLATAAASGAVPIADVSSKIEELNKQLTTDVGRASLVQLRDYADAHQKVATKLAIAAQQTQELGGKDEGLAQKAALAAGALDKIKTALSGNAAGLTEAQKAATAYSEALEKVTKDFPSLKKAAEEAQHAVDATRLTTAARNLDGTGPVDGPKGQEVAGGGKAATEAQSVLSDVQTQSIKDALSKLPGYTAAADNLFTRIFRIESSGDPTNFPGKVPGQGITEADLNRSGAFGQGQFLKSTFDEYFKKTFPTLATGPAALSSTQIAAQRADPEVVKAVAKSFIEDIQASLVKNGNDPSTRNTYLGYNLGPAGANRLLAADPNSSAQSNIDPKSFAGNKSLYGGLTVQEALDKIDRLTGSGAKLTGSGQTVAEAASQKTTEGIDKQIEKLKADQVGANDRSDAKGKFVAAQGQEAVTKNIDPGTGQAITDYEKLNAEQKKLVDSVKAQAAATYDSTHAVEDEKAKITAITDLERDRKTLIEDINASQKNGDKDGLDEKRTRVKALTDEIKSLLPEAQKLTKAFDDKGGVASLDRVKSELKSVKETGTITAKEISDSFTSSAMGGINTFFQEISAGKKPIDALRDAFLTFASDFLKQIANMLLKQALFNAISGSGASGGIASGLNGLTSLFHGGGVVGDVGNMKRAVSPMWFANAPRFHDGGMPGLAPNEIPIIAQRGETVMTAAQTAAMSRNSGGSTSVPIRNVLALGDDQVAAAIAGSHGEQVVMSHIKRNLPTLQKWVRS